MFKINKTEPKVTPGKKTITISGISISGSDLVDEEGNIVTRLAEAIDGLADTFTLKLTLEIPEEE